MRTPLLFAFVPLAFAGPNAQNRWGFGLFESLFDGSTDSPTTATTETTTTTKSGIFGLGLLPNNGGLLGFGLLSGSSESKDDTTTGELCSRSDVKQGELNRVECPEGKTKKPKKCKSHAECKVSPFLYCPVDQLSKQRVCTECVSSSDYPDGKNPQKSKKICNTREKPRCIDNQCSPNCVKSEDCDHITGFKKCFLKAPNPGTCEHCSPNDAKGDNGCDEDKPFCKEVQSGSDPVECVECIRSTDCKYENKQVCKNNACQGCEKPDQCEGLTLDGKKVPVCHNKKCVECTQNGDCTVPGEQCDTKINKCVRSCGSDADCHNAGTLGIPPLFHKCDNATSKCRYQAYFECNTTWYKNAGGTYKGKPGPEIIVKTYATQTSSKNEGECHFHVDDTKKAVTSNCPYKSGNTIDIKDGGMAIIDKMEKECLSQQNLNGQKFGSQMKTAKQGANGNTFVKERTAKFYVELEANEFKFVKK